MLHEKALKLKKKKSISIVKSKRVANFDVILHKCSIITKSKSLSLTIKQSLFQIPSHLFTFISKFNSETFISLDFLMQALRTNMHSRFNFSLDLDPYERENIFEQFPGMVMHLLERLSIYDENSYPTYYPPRDPGISIFYMFLRNLNS